MPSIISYMPTRRTFYWTLGGAIALFILPRPRIAKAAGVLIMDTTGKLVDAGQALQFRLSLPLGGQKYAPVMLKISRETGVSPFLLAAIMQRESAFGATLVPKGPGGTGDRGYGHGLMQIDKRFHSDFLAKGTWHIPEHNLRYAVNAVVKPYMAHFVKVPTVGARILVPKTYKRRGLTPGDYPDPRPLTGELLQAATIASYNAGPGAVLFAVASGADPDTVTTGKDYSTEVVGKLTAYVSKFDTLVG